MTKPLAGTLVVSLDQAVAAPMTARRLADAGARVIKLERPEGDFARYYDDVVKGQCTHYVWLNRGKESVVADLTKPEDRRLFEAMLAQSRRVPAEPQARFAGKARLSDRSLREKHPGLICCSISGYGDDGPYRDRKAYDLLIQAESGLASITGGPKAPARVGVSLVDIGTGLHAYEAILEALIARGRTGEGADIRVSMFDAMMEWMAVPLLFGEHGDAPKRVGLTHFSVAPYGVFQTADGVPILISVQNDREWVVLCRQGAEAAGAGNRPALRHQSGPHRQPAGNRRRSSARCFGTQDVEALTRQLDDAQIAFARVNDVLAILRHPHLRRVTVASPNGPIALPAPPARFTGEDDPSFGPLPALGEHTEAVRREFLG